MLKTPKISVYIPVFNYARYIEKAIQSVLNQTFKDWELIVINDGSTDGTEKILKKVSFILTIILWTNMTMSCLLNEGRKSAVMSGDCWIYLLTAPAPCSESTYCKNLESMMRRLHVRTGMICGSDLLK